MFTNVKKSTETSNSSDRLMTAMQAFRNAQKSKPVVEMIHSRIYPTYVEVFCLVNKLQQRGKIELVKIEEFVCNGFALPNVPPGSDLNLSIYIDENTNSICQAYIAAGKELLPL